MQCKHHVSPKLFEGLWSLQSFQGPTLQLLQPETTFHRLTCTAYFVMWLRQETPKKIKKMCGTWSGQCIAASANFAGFHNCFEWQKACPRAKFQERRRSSHPVWATTRHEHQKKPENIRKHEWIPWPKSDQTPDITRTTSQHEAWCACKLLIIAVDCLKHQLRRSFSLRIVTTMSQSRGNWYSHIFTIWNVDIN